jgi:hypothetical protein
MHFLTLLDVSLGFSSFGELILMGLMDLPIFIFQFQVYHGRLLSWTLHVIGNNALSISCATFYSFRSPAIRINFRSLKICHIVTIVELEF